jgi:hypothetical protein
MEDMVWIYEYFIDPENCRLIAEICIGHQRKGIDDIKGFKSLHFLPTSWSYMDLMNGI